MNKSLQMEQNLHTTAANIPTSIIAPAQAPTTTPKSENPTITHKRIGGTTYQIGVHFSKTNNETLGDKITRLIRHETASTKAVGQ